jgi:hypothetical protein
VKTLADAHAELAIADYGGEEVTRATAPGADGYQTIALTFTTGVKSATAVVSCRVSAETGAALFDHVTLRVAD